VAGARLRGLRSAHITHRASTTASRMADKVERLSLRMTIRVTWPSPEPDSMSRTARRFRRFFTGARMKKKILIGLGLLLLIPIAALVALFATRRTARWTEGSGRAGNRGRRAGGAYAVDRAHATWAVLVDSGLDASGAAILGELKSQGVEPGQVQAVLPHSRPPRPLRRGSHCPEGRRLRGRGRHHDDARRRPALLDVSGK
jgi:hypothetical protein